MNVNPIQSNQPTFGYHTFIKDCWMAGKLESVKKGLYGVPLTKKNCSNEHLICASKGGKTALNNIALADKRINNARGDLPLRDVLTKGQLLEYLAQFVGVRVKYKGKTFDGNKYIQGILETTSKLDLKA